MQTRYNAEGNILLCVPYGLVMMTSCRMPHIKYENCRPVKHINSLHPCRTIGSLFSLSVRLERLSGFFSMEGASSESPSLFAIFGLFGIFLFGILGQLGRVLEAMFINCMGIVGIGLYEAFAQSKHEALLFFFKKKRAAPPPPLRRSAAPPGRG
jgi:hypothetical protein